MISKIKWLGYELPLNLENSIINGTFRSDRSERGTILQPGEIRISTSTIFIRWLDHPGLWGIGKSNDSSRMTWFSDCRRSRICENRDCLIISGEVTDSDTLMVDEWRSFDLNCLTRSRPTTRSVTRFSRIDVSRPRDVDFGIRNFFFRGPPRPT